MFLPEIIGFPVPYIYPVIQSHFPLPADFIQPLQSARGRNLYTVKNTSFQNIRQFRKPSLVISAQDYGQGKEPFGTCPFFSGLPQKIFRHAVQTGMGKINSFRPFLNTGFQLRGIMNGSIQPCLFPFLKAAGFFVLLSAGRHPGNLFMPLPFCRLFFLQLLQYFSPGFIQRLYRKKNLIRHVQQDTFRPETAPSCFSQLLLYIGRTERSVGCRLHHLPFQGNGRAGRSAVFFVLRFSHYPGFQTQGGFGVQISLQHYRDREFLIQKLRLHRTQYLIITARISGLF